MKQFGIERVIRSIPPLDPMFYPIGLYNRAFLKTARRPLGLAVERANGEMASVSTFIHGGEELRAADCYYADRLVKTLLWVKGGFRVYVSGDRAIYEYLARTFSAEGERAYDAAFMAGIFERPFEVLWSQQLPEAKDAPVSIGGHLDGCRIGFDAGGSDRKVSAVIDGEPVYSEEVVWFPKTNSDPQYHYDGICAALRSAAEHMPRVDAVGVSSAGVYINDRTMSASLFMSVPEPEFSERVKDIYIRAVTDTFGDIPFRVVNDGDVTALAGAVSIGEGNVLGIAMGTSEAGGYVDRENRITGWLNELAFVPVDVSQSAMRDEWSGDIGCGVKYFSQDAVIKLAPAAGIELAPELSPAEKLKAVQRLMEDGSSAAAQIFESIGVYLGHSLAYYHGLYGFKHVLLLGRVMSGRGGDIVLSTARRVLDEDYPELEGLLELRLPDEKFRRVGQSVAAASLPATRR